MSSSLLDQATWSLDITDHIQSLQLTDDSYFVHSPGDLANFHGLLPQITTQLDQLECDSSLEPLHAIREQREALLEYQLVLKHHTSPIPRLPVEILQQIFIIAVEWSPYAGTWFTNSSWWKGHRFVGAEDSLEHGRYEFELVPLHERQKPNGITAGYSPHGSRFGDLSQSPWNVSQVCRRWRDIALSTPQMWTYIEIDLDWNIWSERDNWNNLTFLLDLAMERVLHHGLNLIITGIDANSVIKPFIYPLLLRHCQQWRRICLLDNTHFKSPEEIMVSEFPLLENVTMYTNIFPAETKLPRLQSWYSMLPSRRFNESISYYGPLVSALNCQMKARSRHPDNFIRGLQLIASMPRLRTLRITLIEYDYIGSKWPETHSRILLPTIRELSLSIGSAADSSGHTLGLISTPSLKNLHLLSLDVPLPLVLFLDHSCCSLSSLHIDDMALDSQDLQEVLRCIPSLEFLHLTFIAISRAPHWRDTRLIGYIEDDLLEWIFDPGRRHLPLLHRVSLLNLKSVSLDFLFQVLRKRLPSDNRDYSTLALEYVQISLPGFEMPVEYEETLRFFRCRHRCVIEIGPWNLYYYDSLSDGESEAQFTNEPSESEWSTAEEDASGESDLAPDWDLVWESEDSLNDYDYNPSQGA